MDNEARPNEFVQRPLPGADLSQKRSGGVEGPHAVRVHEDVEVKGLSLEREIKELIASAHLARKHGFGARHLKRPVACGSARLKVGPCLRMFFQEQARERRGQVVINAERVAVRSRPILLAGIFECGPHGEPPSVRDLVQAPRPYEPFEAGALSHLLAGVVNLRARMLDACHVHRPFPQDARTTRLLQSSSPVAFPAGTCAAVRSRASAALRLPLRARLVATAGAVRVEARPAVDYGGSPAAHHAFPT